VLDSEKKYPVTATLSVATREAIETVRESEVTGSVNVEIVGAA
jgi:hypothetical protein